MRNLMPIGRFSEICRISIPALRHYDELGLLTPAAVDPETGYRYYSMSQAANADRIRSLRFLEMPLPEIKAILAGGRETNDILARHRDRLREQTERQQYAIKLLDSMMCEEPPMTYEVHLREVQPQQAASIRAEIGWSDIGPFFGQAMGEIATVVQSQGLRFAGAPLTIYHYAQAEESHLDVEVAFPIVGSMKPEGRVGECTIPGGLVATTLHVGTYESVGAAYRALGEWVQEHGHETSGPPREIYLTDPAQVADPAQNRTEIVWPIK